MTRTLARALLATAALALLGLPHAERAHALGFNEDYDGHMRHIDSAARLGADELRVPVGWNDVENPRLDGLYEAALARGITPIFVLWGKTFIYPVTYAKSARILATRFPRAAIGLWNEPNLKGLGAPDDGSGLPPEYIAALVRAGEQAIHQVNPRQRVLGPPMSPGGEWRAYHHAVYDGLRELSIETSLNTYPVSRAPIRELRRLVAWAHTYGHPVAVTELAFRRISYRARRQKLTLRAIDTLHRAGVSTIILHRLVQPQPPLELEWRSWLINGDGTRSKLWAALRRASPAPVFGRSALPAPSPTGP